MAAVVVGACSSAPEEIRVESTAPPTAATSATEATATPDGSERTEATPEDRTTSADVGGDGAEATTGEPSDGGDESTEGPEPAPLAGHYVPVVLAEYPHDERAWTQGLEWHDGLLLESTGLVGESTLRLVDVETGAATALLPAPDDLYTEGVTVVDGEAIQITYQDQTVLRTPLPPVADPAALSAAVPVRIGDAYTGEGWGLCYDGEHLVMTDGSDQLFFRDPDTFEIVRSVVVTLDEDRTVDRLNELECLGDQVLANVWMTTSIVVIDAASGRIEASIDASALVPDGYEDDDGAVLNGIAYNAETATFWLTGKFWPVVYEVMFTPA